MRETQINIKRYKEQLGHIKHKIVSAAILFLMSAVMLTTTSFAWFVLSTSPEISGIATTIAGNGNLEIALANSDGEGNFIYPDVSKVGDSNLELTLRNRTWGNLVNLNDTSYGLHQVTLKPASLNEGNLAESPLQAVQYGSDGRVIFKSFDFVYSNYDQTANLGEGAFIAGSNPQYGVRAISSYTYKVMPDLEVIQQFSKIREDHDKAKKAYAYLVSTDNTYMAQISKMMGMYLQENVGLGTQNFRPHMPTINNLLNDYIKCVDMTIDVYVGLLNALLLAQDENAVLFDSESLLAANAQEIETTYQLTGWKTLSDIKKNSEIHKATLQTIGIEASGSSVSWSSIADIVAYFVDVPYVLIDDKYYVYELGVDEAAGLVFGGGSHKGVITKGGLKDFEQLIGEKMYADNLAITVIITLHADVYTTAAPEYTIPTLIDSVQQRVTGLDSADRVATDVYGMALDFYLRTNADDVYVTLEGEPEIKLEPLKVNDRYLIYKDGNGIYYYHIPNSAITDPTHDELLNLQNNPDGFGQYKTNLSDGNFYLYSTGQIVEFAEPTIDPSTGNTVDERQEFINSLVGFVTNATVTGYDGENRVWQEGVEGVNSSTQGRGSCYIFYPTDSLEQDQMLKLLSALTVAFIDEDGKLLAQATLNTEHAFKESDKVTVPLELNSNSYVVVNDDLEEVRTITSLERNKVEFITALIYLDGERISNEDVNAATNIVGYLNLQFGSSKKLNNMNDEKLKYEEVIVSASADTTQFTYDPANPAKTRVTFSIQGVTPNEVSFRFTRELNAYQGVLGEMITIQGGNWTKEVTFDRPGTYVLRSVWIDGIEYELMSEVRIEVEGFRIDSIEWNYTENEVYVMSSNSSLTTNMTVVFAGEYSPQTVQGLFRSEGNEYTNVYFSKNANESWTGSGTFINSGRYTFESLIIDNEVYAVPDGKSSQDTRNLQKTITLHLGINASASISQTRFDYEGTDQDISPEVSVKIFDNLGNPIKSLSNVTLVYVNQNNSRDDCEVILKWNSSKQSYEGEFNIENPGIYVFNRLTIDGSTITRVNAPSITVISPEPPVYVPGGNTTHEYQFAPDDNAKFELTIENSSSAIVGAVMKNTETGQTDIVRGEGDGSKWTFLVGTSTSTYTDPSTNKEATKNNSQNGTWTIEKLYVTNILYDGKYYTIGDDEDWTAEDAEEPNHITWDVTADNITTYVVNDIKVSVAYDDAQKSKSDFTGVFSESLSGAYSIGGYSNTVTDYWDKELASSITATVNSLTYNHSGDTPTWWLKDNTSDTDKMNAYPTSSTITFGVADSRAVFYYAGTYVPSLDITINGLNSRFQKGSAEQPKYIILEEFVSSEKVTWYRPNVYFDSTSPAVGTKFNTYVGSKYQTNQYANEIISVNPTVNDRSQAKVYFKATRTNLIIYSFYNLAESSATAKIENVGNNINATCTIVGTTGSQSVTYTFTSEGGTSAKSIGSVTSRFMATDTKNPVSAGAKAETVSVTYSGKTYIFELEYPLTILEND